MTIAGLMQRTGLSRSAIHFYLREGLLPQPQKSAVNRSLYTGEHVAMLTEIFKLKEKGLTLGEIKAELRDRLAHAGHDDIDLVGQEAERIHRRILRVATEEFMTSGYRQTRVATIIRKAGITSQVFYAHFPSKGELLVESFRTFIQWNLAFVEPKLAGTSDLGQRLLWHMLADFRANQMGSEVLSLVRSEPGRGTELAQLVEQAWEQIVQRLVAEFESVRKPGERPVVSLELLAYGMIGALHNAELRVSWDDEYSREQLLGAHLWLFLAVLAGMSGEVDIDAHLESYRSLIKEIAAHQPEVPTPLED